ncbi:MAG: hypothetical protein M3393_00070 [Actinomycetota bacterium]|nr:hypothetical protein [Actinomycetota bacterium]
MDETALKRPPKKVAGPALASLVLGLALTACAGQGTSESPSKESDTSGSTHDMEGMTEEEHEAQTSEDDAADDDAASGQQDHGSHGEQGAGHSSAAVTADLVRGGDLPQGYRKGAGHLHSDPDAAAPTVAKSCAPIAELIGTHPSVHQSKYPQAAATFTKSHFGPQVTEAIIDYGDASSAGQALDRVERAGQNCGRYVQSTSPIGANTYTVQSSVPGWTGPDGTTLRLTAMGSDFKALNWDVWATRAGNRLVAVSLRSVAGGSNVDLAPAIEAARAALRKS